MMPSLFIAHGAPLLAIENNEYTQFVNQLGKDISETKSCCAILSPLGGS